MCRRNRVLFHARRFMRGPSPEYDSAKKIITEKSLLRKYQAEGPNIIHFYGWSTSWSGRDLIITPSLCFSKTRGLYAISTFSQSGHPKVLRPISSDDKLLNCAWMSRCKPVEVVQDITAFLTSIILVITLEIDGQIWRKWIFLACASERREIKHLTWVFGSS